MGEFNFREAYSNQENLKNMGNIVRHWSAINLLSEKQYSVEEPIPFSFKPKQKITLSMLFTVLRNHNEGSVYDKSESYKKGHPHQDWSICSPSTQYGFVAQLRSNFPVEIGAVLWLAPFRPCVHPFTQWYLGLSEIPEGFAKGDYRKALEIHFDAIEDIFEYAPENNFLKFVKHARETDEDYINRIGQLKTQMETLETELLQNQESFEMQLMKLYKRDTRVIEAAINDYVKKQTDRSLELLK
jgi:dipeptidase